MNIYLTVDYSTRMLLSNSRPTAIDFVCYFVDALDHAETAITLIAFDGKPKVLAEGVQSSKDVRALDLFSGDDVDPALPDFRALTDLIHSRQFDMTNYEIVFLMETSAYFSMPVNFQFPCAVYFVAVAETFCPPLLVAQLQTFARECALLAGIQRTNNNNSLTATTTTATTREMDGTMAGGKSRDDFAAIEVRVGDAAGVKAAAGRLAALKRTENDVTLSISHNLSLEVHVTPGLPKRPFAILEPELLGREIVQTDVGGEPVTSGRISPPRPTSTALYLLGFVRSANFLLYLPSTPLIHAVKPKTSLSANNLKAFHVFAEALGAEGQLAVFQHANGEECFMRALRSDPSDPWLMCLQFYSSNYFAWATLTDATGAGTVKQPGAPPIMPISPAFDKSKLEFKGISYKTTAQRSYWTDAHGLQSDILKITRLLKRVDRTEQFFQEVQRISRHAIACGYDSFAESMAAILEKRCINIPAENRGHLVKVTNALRKGGFRLASKTQHLS